MYNIVNAPHTMAANVNAPYTMNANVAAPLTMDAYGPQYTSPAYGYGMPAPAPRYDSFTLIVVLFILLIIVGACYLPNC